MFELEVTINLPIHAAQICRDSIQMEAQSEAISRSRITLSCQGDNLLFHVSAADLPAMRAAMNTYLRWINMCAGLTGSPEKIDKSKNGPTDV
jgi:tRNA threonylcarbamoyladenosine modification (KEOPS) complex  Pcc1 subunit